MVYNDKIERVREFSPGLLPQYQAGLFTQNRSVMEQLYLLQQMSAAFQQSKESEMAEELQAVLDEYSIALKKI